MEGRLLVSDDKASLLEIETAGMLLSDNKNYFTTTFWPFMILIPFLGSDRRVTVYLSLVS